ncbi:ABC transporter ATP-binding protein [Trebonia kvetii]|uniref:ABC transporter ATP-binding protein n=1 Tax=Trebonia kvetii TaxID=2480626 RepID=A0A6P2BKM8_9ACTN|nr:ABC transporter ATP-binding protein [Trebonia kvetii]TVY98976.1 ABC transporter ATP-binding protein [Trebonia kvetii]
MSLLELDRVSKSFGGVKAVNSCAFTVEAGSITGMIGPNGAGKTTTLNMIAGELRADTGRILFDGTEIQRKRPHELARTGIARTFQLARELGRLTVMENVCLAPYGQRGESLMWSLFGGKGARAQERGIQEQAREVLATFNLYDKRNDLAASLSGGQKKLLEIARAVMAEPRLLLMDEPTAGVNPALRDRLLEHIRRVNEQGLTVLIVEHNLSVIEELCDDVIVMAAGTMLKRGRLAELRRDSDVMAAYIGGDNVGS